MTARILSSFAAAVGLTVLGLAQVSARDQVIPYHDTAGVVARHADETILPYKSGTSPKRSYAKDFAHVLDCLSRAEAIKDKPDLTTYDLTKAPSRHALETCVFRIAASYETPNDMLSWLKTKAPHVSSGKGGCCGSQYYVSGRWNIRKTGHPWPSNWFDHFWDEEAHISIQYSKDNEVLKVFVFTTD
ncbi:MAG: hypothetical protein AAFQ66_13095 [Pseudomonadota bacterium]